MPKRQCSKHHTIVIGGGVAGLSAAQSLLVRGVTVTVLEAGPRLGGRVWPQPVFTSLPDLHIELGGEFIHGSHTGHFKLAQEKGWEMEYIYEWFSSNLPQQDKIYKNKGGKPPSVSIGGTVLPFDSHSAISKELVSAYERSEGCKTLDEVLKGCTEETRAAAEAFFCQTDGTDTLDEYPCYYVDEMLGGGDEGEMSNYRLKGSNCGIISHYTEVTRGAQILLSSPVTRVEYSGGSVKVTHSEGEVLVCDTVIVAVPISVLQRRSIEFSPALPKARLRAIDSVNITAASKIHIRFSRNVWGDRNLILCADNRFCSQVWCKEIGAGDKVYYVVTGFCTAKVSHAMEVYSEKDCVRAMLLQLETLYPGCGQHYIEGHAIHWSKQPYVNMGYSAFAADGEREVVRSPLFDKLYFAGEATNLVDYGTIGGAIDSGTRAAGELVEHVLKDILIDC